MSAGQPKWVLDSVLTGLVHMHQSVVSQTDALRGMEAWSKDLLAVLVEGKFKPDMQDAVAAAGVQIEAAIAAGEAFRKAVQDAQTAVTGIDRHTVT